MLNSIPNLRSAPIFLLNILLETVLNYLTDKFIAIFFVIQQNK